MTLGKGHWLAALGIALLIHAVLLVLVVGREAPAGTPEPGETGVEIDLGMLGDLGAATETLEESSPAPRADAEPVTEPESEPEPEPEPEPEVKPVAELPPPPPVQEPVIQAKPEPKPEPKPEVKPEPRPKPQPKPQPVKEPVQADNREPQDKAAEPASTAATTNARAESAQAQQKASTGRADARRSGGGNPGVRQNYFSRLAAHLARYKRYPMASRRRGEEGVAKVAFELNRSGQVLSSSIAVSSGSRRLDAAVLEMLKRAQPLPAFPPEMAQQTLSVTLPVEFAIH